MYLARFDSETLSLCAAAIAWAPERGRVRCQLADTVAQFQGIDLTLRLSSDGFARRALVLLSAPSESAFQLQRCHDAVGATLASAAPVFPRDADEYDAMAGAIPPHHARVQHEGYFRGAARLACDFKLYPVLGNLMSGGKASYQVHLRPHRPDAETERRILKYLARLEIEQPFTAPVRDLQNLLAQRLRQPGFIAHEFLMLDDERSLVDRLDRIGSFFLQTAGRVGFACAPLERGDFSELLVTGFHPEEDRGDSAATDGGLPVRGAKYFGPHEVDALAAGAVFGSAQTPSRDEAVIFISYAGNDYAAAAECCSWLEAHGHACWIAPRDIDSAMLPYTEAIARGIARARAVVLIHSELANLSVHIPRELDLAIERKLPIVPVRLAEVRPTGQLNYLLRTCQWLDAFDGVSAEACRRLLSRIESMHAA